MAGWLSTKPRVFERTEKDIGCILSPKSTLSLMQNCDLPPPVKLFLGRDGIFLSSISKIYGGDDEHIRMYDYKDSSRDDKLEILKALRLSQTRAREAERKVRAVLEEKERLSKLIVDESIRGFAYRQWVNLMEFEVLKLQRDIGVCEDCDEGSDSSKKWCTALAFCFAIAFGCRYLF